MINENDGQGDEEPGHQHCKRHLHKGNQEQVHRIIGGHVPVSP